MKSARPLLSLSLLVQGFGMLLMEEAEKIAREEHGSHKISVISGKLESETLFHLQGSGHKWSSGLGLLTISQSCWGQSHADVMLCLHYMY